MSMYCSPVSIRPPSQQDQILILIHESQVQREPGERIVTQKGQGKLIETVTLIQTKHTPRLQALSLRGFRCHLAVGMSIHA